MRAVLAVAQASVRAAAAGIADRGTAKDGRQREPAEPAVIVPFTRRAVAQSATGPGRHR